MKLDVQVTKVTQTANTILNVPEKTLWYLIIGDEQNKTVLNVGQKTHDQIEKLIKERTTTPNVPK